MLVFNDNQYQKNEDIVTYSMEDGTILLNNVTEEVTVINEIGAFVWNCIDNEKTDIQLCDLITSIKNQYHVDDETDVAKEITDFLFDLTQKNALIKL